MEINVEKNESDGNRKRKYGDRHKIKREKVKKLEQVKDFK